MIELDVFGLDGKDLIEYLTETGKYSYLDMGESDFSRNVRVEEIQDLPEDYADRQFIGKISFPETFSKSVKYAMGFVNLNSEYVVIRSYFPEHIETYYYRIYDEEEYLPIF